MEIALNKLKGTWSELATGTGEFNAIGTESIGIIAAIAKAAGGAAGKVNDFRQEMANWVQDLADNSEAGRTAVAAAGTFFGQSNVPGFRGPGRAFANKSAISDKERSKFVDAPEGGMPTMSEGQVAKNKALATKNARMENNRRLWNASLDRKKEARERKQLEAKRVAAAPARKTADIMMLQGKQFAGAIPKLFTGAFKAVKDIERKGTSARVKSGISGQESLLPDWLKKKDEFKKTGQIKPTKKPARIDATIAGTQMGSAAAFTALRRNLKDPVQQRLLKETQKQSKSLETIAANTANSSGSSTVSAPGLRNR